MVSIKLISGTVGLAGTGGAIGGVVHFTTVKDGSESGDLVNFHKTEEGIAKPISVTWKSYIVQAKKSTNELNTQTNKVFCVLDSNCKVYVSSDNGDVQPKSTNLTKVEDFDEIKADSYYVLNIEGKTLNQKTLIQLSPKRKENILLEVISRMSIKSTDYKLPKPPKKFVPREEWREFLKLKIFDKSALEKLQNKLFINRTYPTHIDRENIDHKDYMVFQWKSIYNKQNLHPNKMRMLYIPEQENFEKEWQKEKNTAYNGNFAIYFHPWGRGSVTVDPNNVDEGIIGIDTYLFKTFEEQKTEFEGLEEIEINFLDANTKKPENLTWFYNHTFTNTHIEIYEIEDQVNIAKSLPSDLNGAGQPNAVDWTKIDKDNKMITKLSEMKHDKFYKFVFSNDEVVKKAIENPLVDFIVSINGASEQPSHAKKTWNLLNFENVSQDFHCIRSSTRQKCEYLSPPKTTD